MKYLPKQSSTDDFLQSIEQAVDANLLMQITKQQLIQNQKPSLNFGALYKYLESGHLPGEQKTAKKVLLQAEQFALVDDILAIIEFITDNEISVRPVVTKFDC